MLMCCMYVVVLAKGRCIRRMRSKEIGFFLGGHANIVGVQVPKMSAEEYLC